MNLQKRILLHFAKDITKSRKNKSLIVQDLIELEYLVIYDSYLLDQLMFPGK